MKISGTGVVPWPITSNKKVASALAAASAFDPPVVDAVTDIVTSPGV